MYLSGTIETDYFNEQKAKIAVRDVVDIDELWKQRGYKVYILVKDDTGEKFQNLKE